eukprot:scaffold660583_cov38-Prasinocladus_malaysianus.AAC.1
MYTEENEAVPFTALKYAIGECNYGGRVTDDKDRRLLNTLLDITYQPAILEPGFKLSSSGKYAVPPDGGLASYLATIDAFPAVQHPEAFGLHENADITKDLGRTDLMLATLLKTGGGAQSAAGGAKDDAVGEMAADILRRLPEQFDVEKVQAKYPIKYEESMNQ